jgi:uncharacterized protein YchJ
MRLTEEKIKQAILHPDADVRMMAVRYFADSFSQDPTVMPLLIQAIEQYHWRTGSAARLPSELAQSDETLTWLLQEVARCMESEEEEEEADAEDDWSDRSYQDFLLDSVTQADATLLARRRTDLNVLADADDERLRVIDHRIELLSADPEDCWNALEAICEREKSNWYDNVDVDLMYRLVEAIARQGESQSERVLEVLREEVADDVADHPMVWLEPLAVHIAGEMRLEAAIPLIVGRLKRNSENDSVFEECERALARIGTDAVVEALTAGYADSEFGYRLSTAVVLEHIHSDLVAAKCLELMATEDDIELIAWLGQALLSQFAFDGVEPLRQTILRWSPDIEIGGLRDSFITACTLMETTVPEIEQWKDDAQQASVERAKELAEHARSLDIGDYDEEDDFEQGEEDFRDGPQPIRREQAAVGRNDPCPCGSGKKYKKCCLAKQRQATTAVRQFPIGTVALYGPDDKKTTKIAAAVITHENAEPIIERWVGNNLKENPKVQREIQAFFKRHRVRSTIGSDRNMGCPHEEGKDFPHGGDCPFCPFWKGKQGSGALGARSFDTWES